MAMEAKGGRGVVNADAPIGRQPPRGGGSWAFLKEAVGRGVVPVIPAPALAQAWRTPRQARLHQVVASWVEPLDEPLAKSAGELCGRDKTSNVVDAAVVAGASRRGDVVLSGDPRDLRRLAAVACTVEVIRL
jgi:hypothetical protein